MQSIAEENKSVTDKRSAIALNWGASEEIAEMNKVRHRLAEYAQKREFGSNELAGLVQRNCRTSMHSAYEERMFYSRYRKTAAGKPSKTEAAFQMPAPNQTGTRKRGKLKRMQQRNFVVTFFANLIFIPKQVVCGVLSFAGLRTSTCH